MSRDRRLWLAGRLPRFQFSIANLLALTAAVAFCLGIGRVSVPLGVLVAILVFGTWTSALAVAHGCGTTAYLLAAWTAGTVWYLGASVPISAVGILIVSLGAWPDLVHILLFCAASLGTGAVVRFLPWSDAFEFSTSALLVPSCLMGLLFALFLNVAGWLSTGRIDLAGFSAGLLLGLAVLVGLSLHVGGPLGMLVLEALRDVEKMACDMARTDDDVLDAVALLQTLERRPVTADDVAGKALCDGCTARTILERHQKKGTVRWSDEEGYFLSDTT